VLAVLHGRTHDGQVRLEVELEHAQRLLHISRGRGDGDERQDHIALLHVILDPLLVDRDVTLEEVHALVVDEIAETLRLHVHAEHFPVGRFENALGQVMADEAVHAQNQDFFHALRED